MWVRKWESGWGSKTNNSHSFALPAKPFEQLAITCSLKQSKESLTFTLHDGSGCTYKLPATITKNIGKFTITTDGCSESGDYKFELVVSAWPKELDLPNAKYFSISTVEISPAQTSNNPHAPQPIIRSRRKGTDEWVDGNQIVFNNVDEVYECQAYCSDLPKIHSPIMEVESMWTSFDIEKECTIDLDKMFVDRKFVFSFNSPQSVENTVYEAYITMVKPIDHPDYHKEILVKTNLNPDLQKITDYSLVPGAQYEFKISIKALNITYSIKIEVPKLHPINAGLWKKYFGDVDRMGFYHLLGDHYLFDFTLHFATLYKNGLFAFKKKYQGAQQMATVDQVKFGGSFTLTPIDATTARVDFIKLYHIDSKGEAPLRARTILSPHPDPNPKFLQQGPLVLQVSEIMGLIASHMELADRMHIRLVCKSWSHMVHPLLYFTCTSTTAHVLGFEMKIENEKARIVRETDGAGWGYEYRYDDP